MTDLPPASDGWACGASISMDEWTSGRVDAADTAASQPTLADWSWTGGIMWTGRIMRGRGRDGNASRPARLGTMSIGQKQRAVKSPVHFFGSEGPFVHAANPVRG